MSLLLLISSALATATSSEAAPGIPAELTTFLANADSIDGVDARGDDIAFSIAEKGEAYRITATVHDHEIIGVSLADLGAASRTPGALTWLTHELHDTQIATLAVDADGTVTVATTAGTRYQLIRGKDGNASVAARWAAAWDSPDADRDDEGDAGV